MNEATLYTASKILAAVLTMGSVGIATASNLPDLGLSRQTVAVLAVVQAVIAVALTFMPAVQHASGTVRGGGVADH